MTDRELLELASLSYWGAEIDDVCSVRWLEEEQAIGYTHADNQDHNGCDVEFVWNPLTDDGDALRLAAKLKIDIEWQSTNPFPEPRVEAYQRNDEGSYFCADEPEENYRRAIVRAAAEIGKAMQ